MYTTFNRTLDDLVEKTDRTQNVYDKRVKKIDSLVNLIKTYENALEDHREFAENRKVKIAAERKVLAEMQSIVDEVNETFLARAETKASDELPESGDRGFSYDWKSGVLARWDELVRDFNRIHQGHGGELLKAGSDD